MPTHTPVVRVLFLGCGMATRMHSKRLSGMRGVELAYASRDAAKAAEFCRRFRGVASWGSYGDALADHGGEVNVSLVATPTATHVDLAHDALRARHHVIVEKPAFLHASDFCGVRDAAGVAQRSVFVAENYVYKPIACMLRDVIGARQLGEVRFVSINATKRQPASDWRAVPALSGGGALFEAGIHWVSFAARIGLDVTGVRGLRVGPPDGPDRSSLVMLRYAGGAAATIAHSWEIAAPFGGARISTVQGTRGAVTFESNGMASMTTGVRRTLRLYPRDPLGFRAMFADFVRCVRTSGTPVYTLDMAQRDLRWLELAHQGLDTPMSGCL
ncbi:MAG TPA: Gfo/Idh/MocA family oxidoreductase [Gemmatimonas sp.]|nr:Gfo/Idh/MocA family oxidoreductase [Gemmatimonas sp.]